MTRPHLALIVSALVTGITAEANAVSPDLPEGRIYVLHSSATGSCPSLDWHIVVERNDVLAGMVAWDNMRSMGRATGRVNRKDSTFQMTVVELGGRGRTATVEGTIGDNGTATAAIKGPAVSCESVTVRSYIDADRK
jgi:hypothetical protein